MCYCQTFFKSIKEDGVVKQVIGTAKDITRDYQQREELEKSREYLNLALEAGDVAAWTYDVENKTFHTLQGDALAGNGLSLEQNQAMIHPDDVQMQSAIFNSIIEGRATHAEAIFRYKATDTASGYRFYESKMSGRKENGRVKVITGTQKDITDSHLRQQQLEEYRLKTNLINKECNIIQWDYDCAKNVLNTYSPDAILPHQDVDVETYLKFVHPDDVERVRSGFGRARNREYDTINIEIRLLIPGADDYKRVVLNGVPVVDQKGNILKYTGIRRDVSRWVEINEKLTEQNYINNLILSNINSGLVYINTDCVIQWSNLDAFGDMVRKMEVGNYQTGNFCNCMVNGKCDRKGRCLVREAINSQTTHKREYTYNESLTIDATSIPVYNSEGKISGALFKLDDITDRRRLNKELESTRNEALRSNQILNEIIDRIPGAMYIKDAQNEFRYLRANNEFCKISSKSEKEILGNTDFEVFDSKAAKIYNAYDKILLGGEKTVAYESSPIINGEQEHWHINKSIIKTADGQILILGISTNVTELHNINHELIKAKERAEESDKLKSSFLANMSHEIRTPLNAIVGFSELLAETEDRGERAEYLQIINTNNDLLFRLIGDILDLSKIESGIIELKYEQFDLVDVFHDIYTTFKQKMDCSQVEFLCDNPYDKCIVTLDKNRLKQVVTNFLSNAIKYTPSGHIKMGYKYDNGGIKLYVEDTGIGIAKDKHDKVFTRFEKLDDFAQGTGLGLSICKAIAKVKHGDIGFDSQEGKGSTFWVWFPTDAEVVAKNQGVTTDTNKEPLIQAKAEQQVGATRPLHILVAEDNDSNFLLVRSILKEFDVTRAVDGVEVVEKARTGVYDIIFMDMRMPVLDGLEATREIREFDSQIPIVAVTANAFDSDKTDALKAGCNYFITKPLKKAHIMTIISRLL